MTSYQTTRVVAVGLSPRDGASLQACTTAGHLLRGLDVEVECRSTVGLPLVAAGVDAGPVPKEIVDLLAAIAGADAVVLGAPVHRSAIAGVSRNWIELLRDGLVDKPVLPIVAAGSARAHLVAEQLRADLWANFSARPTRTVLVTPELTQDELVLRLGDALGDLLTDVLAATSARLVPLEEVPA